MANHKSAIKRNRSNESKMLTNKYKHKTTRTVVQKLREETDKKKALKLLPYVSSLLDKLAKKNIIHKKKASNLKSNLSKKLNSL